MQISYFTNEVIDEINHNPKVFFDMQDVIKKDFIRIKYMIENYNQDTEQQNLINYLNEVIDNIQLNRFEKVPEMGLDIRLTEEFLIFSYYKFNENKDIIFDTPSIVIVSRMLTKIYFIDEIYDIFKDDEDEDDYNRGCDEVTYFILKNGKIKQYNSTLYEYTKDLFSNCFDYDDSVIHAFLCEIEEKSCMKIYDNNDKCLKKTY